MTFVLVLAAGLGIILITSAFEDISIAATLQGFLTGRPITPVGPSSDMPTPTSPTQPPYRLA